MTVAWKPTPRGTQAPVRALGRGRRTRTCVLLLSVLIWVLSATGCERRSAPPPAGEGAAAQPAADSAAPLNTADSAAETTPVVLILGDSITAGFGLPIDDAYPALIQARLRSAGYPHRVVNAGVSGDTSAGGLARMDWILRQRVDVLVLALGGNDGLRGRSTEAMRDNLAAIIEKAQGRGIRVILAGMQMPTNYGEDYTRRFAAVFPALAKEYDLALVPFLLEGVAMQTQFNQADGIHPNAAGAERVADNVWTVLKPSLQR